MKKILIAVLIATMIAGMVIPIAFAEEIGELNYSVSTERVELDEAGIGSFDISVPKPAMAYAGVEFMVQLSDAATITSLSYSIRDIGRIPPTLQKSSPGRDIFGFSCYAAKENTLTDDLVCTVEVSYKGRAELTFTILEVKQYIFVGDHEISEYVSKAEKTVLLIPVERPPGCECDDFCDVCGGCLDYPCCEEDDCECYPCTCEPETPGECKCDDFCDVCGGCLDYPCCEEGNCECYPCTCEPAVISVTVSPPAVGVQQGARQAFTATVIVERGADKAVTWSVSGNSSAVTTIDGNGLLFVSVNEGSASLTVTATSDFDPMVSGSANVTVLPSGRASGAPGSPPVAEIIGAEEVPLDPGPGFPFEDVLESHWFYGNVYYMWENGLMKGTSERLFSPYMNLTRGMVVTVLYRMEGEPDVSGLSSFTDVPEGVWYSDAISWAADKDIALGFGDGTFHPNENVTREQMAAFVFRYAKHLGVKIPATIEYADFADQADISEWAAEAVEALYMAAIIQGRDNNRFDPKGLANRAEYAAILHRFLEADLESAEEAPEEVPGEDAGGAIAEPDEGATEEAAQPEEEAALP